jgi:hypothetical protein
MKDQGLDMASIVTFETSHGSKKGYFYGFRKMFWKYLNKLNVPFSDPCCETAATGPAPVGVEDGLLKYFNGTIWTRVDLSQLVDPTPYLAQQDLSGAGAIGIDTYYTAWTTTAADAGTLADGVLGQLKKIELVVDGGDGTLTPANLAGGTTITFANVNEWVLLYFDGTDWVVIENHGTTVA